MFYSLLQKKTNDGGDKLRFSDEENEGLSTQLGGTVMTRVGVRVTVQVQFTVGESATTIYSMCCIKLEGS